MGMKVIMYPCAQNLRWSYNDIDIHLFFKSTRLIMLKLQAWRHV